MNNPISTSPIEGYGKSDIIIVNYIPYTDDILLGRPSTINYDVIKRIFDEVSKKFYYTHVIKCLGAPTKNQIGTCKSTWLNKEIEQIKPQTVFTLGSNTTTILTGCKGKLTDLLGREIIINNIKYVPNYNPSYVLNQGKAVYETFKSVFINNI